MAIDTAAKRFSMMNFGRQPVFPLFPPDSSVDSGDQYHMLTLYSGIALEEAVTAAGGIRKIRVKKAPKGFFPWEQPENDEFIEEVIEEIKKKPKLKIVKKTITPDFDEQLQLQKIDEELIAELQEAERRRIKRIRHRKAIEMLLLS